MSQDNLKGIVGAVAGMQWLSMPRVSISMSPLGVRIEEDATIKINPHATLFVYKGCVLSQSSSNEFSFSAPLPMVRASFGLKWDGHIRGLSQNPTKRTVTIKIDGLPDQTLSY